MKEGGLYGFICSFMILLKIIKVFEINKRYK